MTSSEVTLKMRPELSQVHLPSTIEAEYNSFNKMLLGRTVNSNISILGQIRAARAMTDRCFRFDNERLHTNGTVSPSVGTHRTLTTSVNRLRGTLCSSTLLCYS